MSLSLEVCPGRYVSACAPWDRRRLAGLQINWAEGPAFLDRPLGSPQ
jgi:hypothetical protein